MLTVQNAEQSQTADNVTVVRHRILTVASATQAQTASHVVIGLFVTQAALMVEYRAVDIRVTQAALMVEYVQLHGPVARTYGPATGHI
jgi:hypothetical protein